MDGLLIATYRYGVIMQCSTETRRMLLSKIIIHVPSHAEEPRELGESKCIGCCRYLSFTSDASDRVRNLILRMILSSLGSQCRGEARSRGWESSTVPPRSSLLTPMYGLLLITE